MVLALDVDDVLVEFNSRILKIVNEKFEEIYPHDELEDLEWNFDNLPAAKRSYAHSLFSNEAFHLTLDIDWRAREFFSWAEKRFDVVIVTSAHAPIIPVRDRMLKGVFGTNVKVIYTAQKHLVAADFLIDDSPFNITNSIARYPIVITQPWNETYLFKNRVEDLEGLRQFLDSKLKEEIE